MNTVNEINRGIIRCFILSSVFIFFSCAKSHHRNTKNTLDELEIKGSVKRLVETRSTIGSAGGDTIDFKDAVLKFSSMEQMDFNEQGFIVFKKYASEESELNTSTKFYYNDAGYEVAMMVRDVKGMPSDSQAMNYDKNGKILLNTCFRGNGNLYRKDEYIYNDKGQEKRVNIYGDDDKITFYCINEFNDAGLKIKTNNYFEDGAEPLNMWEYKYDADGKLVLERSVDPDGSIKLSRKYTYNKKGNLETEVELSADITEKPDYSRFKYVYDESGNWIKKIEYWRGNLIRIIDRKMEYTDD